MLILSSFDIECSIGTRIMPYSTYSLSVHFDSRSERGAFQDRLEVVFEDTSLNRRFSITRPLLATVGVHSDYEALKPSTPYVRPQRKPETKITSVIPGVPPPSAVKLEWLIELGDYKAPPALMDTAFRGGGSPQEIVSRIKTSFLPTKFDRNTYGKHFSTLLWIEEERARYVFVELSRD